MADKSSLLNRQVNILNDIVYLLLDAINIYFEAYKMNGDTTEPAKTIAFCKVLLNHINF